MAFLTLAWNEHSSTFQDYLDPYFKKKPPDCNLYSEEGSKFRIHKELLSQTNFLREILSSAKESCYGGTIGLFLEIHTNNLKSHESTRFLIKIHKCSWQIS